MRKNDRTSHLEMMEDEANHMCISGYELGPVIGEGSFSIVRQATKDDKVYSIKVISKDSLVDEHCENQLVKEIKLLQAANHPNILRYIDVFETDTDVYLVTEWIQGMTLLQFVNSFYPLEEDTYMNIFDQILEAIAYLHKRHIVHRDIKLENIMIDKNYKVKLIDFGLASHFTENSMLSTCCGSFAYISPECARNEKYIGTKHDIWACGIILYSMVFGKLPWSSSNALIALNEIMNWKLKIPEYCPLIAKSLLNRMLHDDPQLRPPAEQLLLYTQGRSKAMNGFGQGSIVKQPIYISERSYEEKSKHASGFLVRPKVHYSSANFANHLYVKSNYQNALFSINSPKIRMRTLKSSNIHSIKE